MEGNAMSAFDKDGRLICSPENAEKLRTWIKERGGLYVWESQLIGEAPRSWTTPATTTEGQPFPPPDWRCGNAPARHITLSDGVAVETVKEVGRVKNAIALSGRLKRPATDRWEKLKEEHPGAFYSIEGGDLVVFVTETSVSLKDYAKD